MVILLAGVAVHFVVGACSVPVVRERRSRLLPAFLLARVLLRLCERRVLPVPLYLVVRDLESLQPELLPGSEPEQQRYRLRNLPLASQAQSPIPGEVRAALPLRPRQHQRRRQLVRPPQLRWRVHRLDFGPTQL